MTSTTTIRSAPATGNAPIPFSRLLRAELRKTTDTRAARWLLAATAPLTLGGLALPLIFPHEIHQTRPTYLFYAGLGLTRTLPILLLMAVTAEWSQHTGLVTFTQEPRRARIVRAKLTAGMLLAAVLAVLGWLATEAVVAVARAAGRTITSRPAHDWPQTVGYFGFVLLVALVGMAFGAVLQNTAAAIVAFFTLGALANLFFIGALRPAGHWVNTTETFGWVLDGDFRGHGPQIAVSVLIWIGVPLATGLARTLRREVR